MSLDPGRWSTSGSWLREEMLPDLGLGEGGSCGPEFPVWKF